MRFRLPLFVTLTAFLVLSAQADEAKQPNYLVFAIKTDLQRELLNSRADAYLQFDVEECVQDRKFDPKRFDAEEFRKTLASLAHQLGKAKPRVFIGYRYANGLWRPRRPKPWRKQ